jgi:hypothetical protein
MLSFNVFWILVRRIHAASWSALILPQVLTIWGLIGVHTDKFGFKHVWEIWSAPFPSRLRISLKLRAGYTRPSMACSSARGTRTRRP